MPSALHGGLSLQFQRHFFAVFLAANLLVAPVLGAASYEEEIKLLSSRLAEDMAKSGKKTIAVVDFTDLQGNVTELGRFLAEEFSVALTQEAKGFQVIERTYLKTILREYRLSATGLIAPETARKVGQLAGADMLLTGTITPFGDSIRLSVKVIDTDSARILSASSVDIPKTKAIEELSARGISDTGNSGQGAGNRSDRPPQNQSTVARQPAKQLQDNGYLFTLKDCQRSSETIACSGAVTDKTNGAMDILLDMNRSYLLDDLGNQFQSPHVVLGAQGARQMLQPELPMNFVLSVKGANPEAKSISVVLSYQGNASGTITFRNVALQVK